VALVKLTRRELLLAGLTGTAAGGSALVLGYFAGADRERWKKRMPPRSQPFAPSVFLAIDDDGQVTVWVTKSEMGQGVQTALPMLVAEELDADWSKIRIEQAVGNLNYGGQLTGSSSSVRGMWQALRESGAAAREMLVAAAAQTWGVTPAECSTERGMVVHSPSGRRLGYGSLAAIAAALPVPSAPRLKEPAEFRIIGQSLPRLDIPSKVDGSAVFGVDVRPPGLLFAAVARCLTFGGKLVRYDDARARSLPGVKRVLSIPSGVAVVADSTWAAFRARDALDVTWDHGPSADFATPQVSATLRGRKDAPGQSARSDGDVRQALGAAAQSVEAEYELPYLAHATMEPINCTARVQGKKCEIWAPTQAPDSLQQAAAELLGFELADVVVRVPLLGGGFGRRIGDAEWREAVEIARHVDAPVQVVWTREDDIRRDYYRPASLHRMQAGLDAQGMPVAWHHVIVSPSIIGVRSEQTLDGIAVEGAHELPYAVPNVAVEWVSAELPVPVGFWRSVAHSYTAFAVECFVDEIAAHAGKDPVELRRALLRQAPRHLAVLERAAEQAGWGAPLPPGRARGVAVHASFGSYVAMVAEVALDAAQRPRVERVVAAVDCGLTVHPDNVVAQIEGGIVFGLTAALHGKIAFDKGAVVESNFHDYPLLRIDRMPQVEVHLIASTEAPGGVGEIAVPPIAPAVCNALFALTKQRARMLPLVQA
jgi:isoquinoline 1-oxidoreductase subunit beta